MKVKAFHDQAKPYCIPQITKFNLPTTLSIRLDSNIDVKVYLEITFNLFRLQNQGYQRYETTCSTYLDKYYMYSCVAPATKFAYKYHFVVEKNGEVCYYTIDGLQEKSDVNIDFLIIPDFDTPDWSKGALWYQIMPDSFNNGDILNDKRASGTVKENSWGNSHMGGDDYFGGDLQGIIDKLDYLQSLNVEVVSLNPIWIATHQAGYGSDDLTEIDPCFGNDEMLIKLKKELKKRGMRLVLDGVFDYMIYKSKWVNREGIYPLEGGMKKGEPYYDLILRDKSGKEVNSFWEHPLMDFSNSKYREIIFEADNSIVKTYLKPPYNIDGWRMDVGNIYDGSDPLNFGSSPDIMLEMRKSIKECGEDKILISENDTRKMRVFGTFDSKWNYEVGTPLRNYAMENLTDSEFISKVKIGMFDQARPVANASFNHVTTHDTQRILNISTMPSAIASTLFLMTFVGAPSIYFGDETGTIDKTMKGLSAAAPTSFSSMNWQENEWNKNIHNLYLSLSMLRKKKRELFKDGGLEVIYCSDADKMNAFARFKDDDFVITTLNRNDYSKDFIVDISMYMTSGKLKELRTNRVFSVVNGMLNASVMAGGGIFVKDFTSPYLAEYIAEVSEYDGKEFKLYSGGNISFKAKNCFELNINIIEKGNFDIVLNPCGNNVMREKKIISVENNFVEINGLKKSHDKIITNIKITRQEYNNFEVITKFHEQQLQTFNVIFDFASEIDIVLMQRNCDGKYNIDFKLIKAQRFTDFKNGFGNFFNDRAGKIIDGQLVLNKNEKITADCPYGDYTIKTEFVGCGGKAGISVMSGNNGIFAGFISENILGVIEYIKGEPILLSEVVVDTNKANIHLQKCGTRWSIYAEISKEEFKELINNFYFNYSYASLILETDKVVKFKTLSIGDEIEGNSAKDYLPVGNIDMSFDNYAARQSLTKYKIGAGNFEYVYGGIKQTACGASLINVLQEYQNFCLEFTLTAQILKLSGSFFVNFSDDMRLILSKEYITLQFCCEEYKTLNLAKDSILADKLRIIIIAECGKFKVFIGNNENNIFNIPYFNKTFNISYGGNNLEYTIQNFNISHADSDMNIYRGTIRAMKEGLDFSCEGTTYAYLNTSVGVNDFAFGANIKLAKSASVKSGYFAFCYGTSSGAMPEQQGVSIRFYVDGIVEVVKCGNIINTAKIINFDNESFYIHLENRGGKCKLLVAPNEYERELVDLISFDVGNIGGGCIMFYGEYTRTVLCGIMLKSIKKNENTDDMKCNIRIDKSKHRYVI